MATDAARRALLKTAAWVAATASIPRGLAAITRESAGTERAWRSDTWPEMLGSWLDDGLYYAGRWSPLHGATSVMLPSRAHGVLYDGLNPEFAIVVARRPGDYLVRFPIHGEREAQIEKAEATRVFNGHAAFSLDGATLYTTENSSIDGSGFIGLRDARSFSKRGEWPTHGMDPHAMLVEPDGTLLVANGGILTLPDAGRVKLDQERMDPSLVRIDGKSGTLLGQWRLTDPRLSIRHLARASDGSVGVALQGEHVASLARKVAPPFAHFNGTSLHVGDVPPDMELGGYGGDIAHIPGQDGGCFAVSCVRTNQVACWNLQGQWIGAIGIVAPCALAESGGALIVASEAGSLMRVEALDAKPSSERVASLKWDNHIVAS